jgi:hypothetical protein
MFSLIFEHDLASLTVSKRLRGDGKRVLYYPTCELMMNVTTGDIYAP